MNDVPDTELFSAYLDGELTAAEQVRVEQMLATSPEARQLVEELRALGSTLQNLPQQKLEGDFAAAVLRTAERRMLAPEDNGDKPAAGRAAEALQPHDRDTGGLGSPWRNVSWRGMLSKRAIAWSALIVVVAVIIHVTSPPPPKLNQDLARSDAPELAEKDLAPPAAGEKRRGSDGGWDVPAGQPRRLRGPEAPAKTMEADSPKEKEEKVDGGMLTLESKSAGKRGLAGSGGGAETVAAGAAPATPTEPAMPPVPAKNAEGRDAGDPYAREKAEPKNPESPAPAIASKVAPGIPGEFRETLKKDAAKQTDAAIADKKPTPADDSISEPKPIAPAKPAAPGPSRPAGPAAIAEGDRQDPDRHFRYSGKDDEAAGSSRVAKTGDQPARKSAGKGNVAPDAEGLRRPYAGKGGLVRDLANDVDSKSDQQRLPETTPAEQPVSSATFVRVDISAQAVRDKVFEDLLVRNGLSLRPMMFAASSLGQELNMQQAGMAANSHLPAGRAQTLPSQTTARGASNLQQQQSAPRSSAATSMTYECEINAAQLDFIVKQIKENSTAFSQVRLELLPRGETQTQVAGDPAERGASRSGLKLNEANRAASESLYATNGASRSDQKPGDAANQRPLAEQQVAESSVGGLGQGGQAKSQATPDTAQQAQDGRADPPKQRVVFVLNVVERPYADAARQAPPAAAAPAKAEVKSKE